MLPNFIVEYYRIKIHICTHKKMNNEIKSAAEKKVEWNQNV